MSRATPKATSSEYAMLLNSYQVFSQIPSERDDKSRKVFEYYAARLKYEQASHLVCWLHAMHSPSAQDSHVRFLAPNRAHCMWTRILTYMYDSRPKMQLVSEQR